MTPDEAATIFKRPLLSTLYQTVGSRPCQRCKGQTFWAKPAQSTRGYCAHHAINDIPVSYSDAVRRVIAALPDFRVVVDRPFRYAPDEYAVRNTRVLLSGRFIKSGDPLWVSAIERPLDAGPCENCRRVIRRYGPYSYPKCTECEPPQ